MQAHGPDQPDAAGIRAGGPVGTGAGRARTEVGGPIREIPGGGAGRDTGTVVVEVVEVVDVVGIVGCRQTGSAAAVSGSAAIWWVGSRSKVPTVTAPARDRITPAVSTRAALN